MQDLLELLVSIKTTGIDQLNKVEGSLKQVSAGAQSGDKEFAKFQSRIEDFTKSGLSLRDSLQVLANESNGFGASLRKMAVDALAADKEFASAAKSAEKVADAHEKATARIAASLERRTAAEASAAAKLATMGAGYAAGIPSFASRGGFQAGLGPALAGVSAAIAAFGLLRSAAEQSRETVNAGSRLDLPIAQTRQLQNEARLASVNFGSLENAQRSLSAALEDGTGSGKRAADTLAKLGIDTVTSTGDVRSMGPVLLDVIDKLSDIPSKTERAAEGNRILGRGYKELEPLINSHHELQKELSKYGLILDENLISKLSDADTKFNALGIAFDNLKAKIAGGIAPLVIPLVVGMTNPFGFMNGGGPYPTGGPGQGKFGAFLDDLTGESRGEARRFTETPSNTPSNPAVDTILRFNSTQIAAQNAGARDRFGKFLGGQGDSEEKLRKNTEDAKKTYMDSLNEGQRVLSSKGSESEAFAKSTEEITKNKAAYDGLNASLKALEGSKGNAKFVMDLVDRLQGNGESPITRLFNSSKDDIAAHPYLTSGQRGQVNDATLNAANQLLADARDKQDEEQARTDNNFTRGAGRYDRNSAREVNADLMKGLERWDKDIVELAKDREKQQKSVDTINRQSDRDQTSAQSSRVLRNIDLNAGPGTGGQKRAADEAYAYRLSQAEQFQQKELNNLTDITTKRVDSARIEAEYKKLVWQAEDEHETKLLELQHKRQEASEQLSGKIFDSLQKPGGFQALIKNQLNDQTRQIFENVTAPILGGVSKSISGSMPQGNPVWNDIFKGTILEGGSGGKDTPVIAAQDRTTAAVDLVRQTIEATATGKPLPSGQAPRVAAGVSGAGTAAAIPASGAASSSPLSGLMSWLGLAGLGAASINGLVNAPGFPGAKEIDEKGGLTNPATVSHNFQNSAHTGAASRIFSSSVGLAGSVTGALTKISGFGRGAVYVDQSGNVVSGSGEAGAETWGVPTDGSSGDYGGEVSASPYSSGSGETPYEGSGYPTYGMGGDYGGEVTPGSSSAAMFATPGMNNVVAGLSVASSPSTVAALASVAPALTSFSKGLGASLVGSNGLIGNIVDAQAGTGFNAQLAGSAVGVAGAVAAGTLSALKDFSGGGARNDLAGAGSVLGTASLLAGGPSNPIGLGLMAAGLGASLISALLPDPRTVRQQQETSALQSEQWVPPPTINSTQSLSGNVLGTDKYGEPISAGSFGAFDVTQPYQVKMPNGAGYATVPGSVSTTTISPGTATPGAAASANSGSTGSAAPQIHVHVSAMDSQSVMQRAPDIAAAVNSEIQKGGAISFSIQRAVLGS